MLKNLFVTLKSLLQRELLHSVTDAEALLSILLEDMSLGEVKRGRLDLNVDNSKLNCQYWFLSVA